MAIRSYPWLDGFDYYATDHLLYKWADASEIHVSPTGGRRNSGCITPTGAGYLVSRPFESWDTITESWVAVTHFSIAFAVFRQTVDAFKVIAESSGNTGEFEFELTCSGRIGYRQTGGTWYYTDGIVPMGEWCHVFLHISTDGPLAMITAIDSDGDYLITDLIDGSALGWTFDGSPLFSTWRVEAAVCGNWRMDDLYVNDAYFKTADYGDCRIDALEMVDDDPASEYAEWTLSAGSSFAGVVNQVAETATATSVSATFACVNSMIGHNPTSVYAVQSNAWATDLGAGCGVYLTAGSNDSDFLDVQPSEDGLTYTWTQNTGSPWDQDTVNAATIGVQVSD